jgi:excisionase family DNA binding protein
MTSKTPRNLVTIKTVAQRLEVTEITVRRMIADGRLTAYRIGGHLLRVDSADVDALIIPVAAGTTAGYIKGGLR